MTISAVGDARASDKGVMKMRASFRFILAAVLASGAVACGGQGSNESREKQMEETTKRHGFDADVDLDAKGDVKSVEIEGPNGVRHGQNVSLPADFPSDVPMIAGWNVISIAPAPQGGYMLQATVEDTAESVAAALRSKLTANGWAETNAAQQAPTMQSIQFEKDDRTTNVNIIDAGPTVMVQMRTGPKL